MIRKGEKILKSITTATRKYVTERLAELNDDESFDEPKDYIIRTGGFDMAPKSAHKEQRYIATCDDISEGILVVYDCLMSREVYRRTVTTEKSLANQLDYIKSFYKNITITDKAKNIVPYKRPTKDREQNEGFSEPAATTTMRSRVQFIKEVYRLIDKYNVGMEVKQTPTKDDKVIVYLIENDDNDTSQKITYDMQTGKYSYHFENRLVKRTAILEQIFE